jgi:hypothetical protein
VNRTVAALLALLAVLALGSAAATLDAAPAGGGSGGTGAASGAGVGSGERVDFGAPAPVDSTTTAFDVPRILYQVLLVLLAVALGVGLLGFYAEYGARGFLVVFGAGAVLTVLLWLVLQGVGGGEMAMNGTGGLLGERSPSLPGGAAAGEANDGVAITDPPSVLVGLFALVLLGALAVVARASGDDETVSPPPSESTGPGDVAAVGRAAGRAADRIESEEGLENGVYRAWREMTRHLDVARPESSTPTEFAAAAVDAGMDREDVGTLTGLFEEVRYGDADPTGARERRAIDALRRIERDYADGSGSEEAGTV